MIAEPNFRTLVEHTHVAMLVHQAGTIVYVNPRLVALLGHRAPGELIGRAFGELFHGHDIASRLSAREHADPIATRLVRADGSAWWAEASAAAIDLDGKAAVLITLRDLTTGAALRESEGRFWSLFSESPIPLWEHDMSSVRSFLAEADGDQLARPEVLAEALRRIHVIAVNEAAIELFGATRADDLVPALPSIFGEESRWSFRALWRALLAGEARFETETIATTLQGKVKHVSLRVSVIPGHEATWSRVVMSIFDLTRHEEAESRIRAALREKEVLLREVHHRVKNNLQVISSLLNLQASHLEDQEVRALFAESQNRVHAICSRELAERLGPQPNLQALSDQTFLIHTDMPLSFDAWKEAHGVRSLQPAAIDHYDSGQLILEAAAQGLCIAIMHDDHLKRNHDPRLSLLYDDFEVDSPYSYWFVCRHVDLESRPVRLFHDWLVEARL